MHVLHLHVLAARQPRLILAMAYPQALLAGPQEVVSWPCFALSASPSIFAVDDYTQVHRIRYPEPRNSCLQ